LNDVILTLSAGNYRRSLTSGRAAILLLVRARLSFLDHDDVTMVSSLSSAAPSPLLPVPPRLKLRARVAVLCWFSPCVSKVAALAGPLQPQAKQRIKIR
jgi:hypothetical protein